MTSSRAEQAARHLNEAFPEGFAPDVRFEISGIGELLLGKSGAAPVERPDPVDCVLRSDAGTFAALLDGSLDPVSAYMSGKLEIEGDLSIAMRLSQALK